MTLPPIPIANPVGTLSITTIAVIFPIHLIQEQHKFCRFVRAMNKTRISKLNHSSVGTSLDAYIEESSNPDSDATDLVERLAPLDSERIEVMKAIIDARRRLVEILDNVCCEYNSAL